MKSRLLRSAVCRKYKFAAASVGDMNQENSIFELLNRFVARMVGGHESASEEQKQYDGKCRLQSARLRHTA